jgi:hypothetical protein
MQRTRTEVPQEVTERVNTAQLFSGHEAHIEALRLILKDQALLERIQAIGEKDSMGNSELWADLEMWLEFCDEKNDMYILYDDSEWEVEIPVDLVAAFKKKIDEAVKAHLEAWEKSPNYGKGFTD